VDSTAALTRGEPSEAHERLVFEQPFENRLVGGVLGENVGALRSRPYGYPACEGGELTTAVAFIFFGEVAKGPTCLDLLGSLSMDVRPSRVGGPASQDGDNSPLLVAEGRGCAGALYQRG
jgi:hypothetical protein